VIDEEYEFVFSDGTHVTVLASGAPLRDERGQLIGAVLIGLDITARKRAEAQRDLLVRELHHRVKNTLAVVQALTNQSLRGIAIPPEVREALNRRLRALSDAHLLLLGHGHDDADLADVVTLAIEPYASSADPARFMVEGPSLRLPGRLALTFALLLHELATNAAKYGALSTEAGRVAIRWNVERADGYARIRFSWTERDGPPVAPPTTRGFGTKLIERSLSRESNASVTLRFEPAGVVCEMQCDLAEAALAAA
jgi:two-component sensor histidine kinase